MYLLRGVLSTVGFDSGSGGGLLDCGEALLRQTNWLFSLGILGVMRSLLMRRMVGARYLHLEVGTD